MGVNSSKRLAAKCQILSKDEQAIVSTSFRLASKNSDKIKEDELMVLYILLYSAAIKCVVYRNYGAHKRIPD